MRKYEQKQDWMKTPVELPELPWAKDALAPIISEETINFHHGKAKKMEKSLFFAW